MTTNKNLTTLPLKSLCLVFFLFLFLVLPITSKAQTFSEFNNSDSLAFDISPHWPKPQEVVKIHLDGYGFSLNLATISWYINKDRKQSGLGLNSFSFQAPNAGENVTVTAVVTSQNGDQLTKQITFIPATVDFLVEADSYTPMGYRGAALPGPYTKVKVVAIPNIKNGNNLVPPERVNFTWKQDGQIQTNQGGVGRDYFLLQTKGYPYNTNIEVTAKAINSGVTAQNKITIQTVKPDIVLYPYLPLSGVKLSALTNKIEAKGDFAIKAEPYYLDRQSVLGGRFLYNFTVNNKAIINQDSLSGLLNLVVDTKSDLANIDLTVSHLSDTLQQYRQHFGLTVVNNVFNQ